MKVLIIEHAEGRADGIGKKAVTHNVEWCVWKAYNDSSPNIDLKEFGGLIIGGGPMGAYDLDNFPFFKSERVLVESAIKANIPILGICLGAQILASIMGGKVEKTFLRKGYLYVEKTKNGPNNPLLDNIAQRFPTFQYHKDEITILPDKAVLLCTSDNCFVEGFSISDKPIWGVQFHPEIGYRKASKILNANNSDNIEQLLLASKDPLIKMNSLLLGNFFSIMKKSN